MNWRQPIVQLFIDPDKIKALSLLDWQAVIFILRDNNLLATFAAWLEQHQLLDALPPYAQKHLHSAQVTQQRLQKQTRFEALKLHQSLMENHFDPPVFLKGAAYALLNNLAGQGRVFSDIDMLVTKAQLADIERLLLLKGWMQKDITDYDDKYYRIWAHEIPPMYHGTTGTVIDVHHNLVPVVSGRSLDIAKLLSEHDESANGCRVLSLPAMVLHSVVHLFFNEDFTNGFRDLLDQRALIGELSTQQAEQLLLLAKHTGFDRELFYSLRYLDLVLNFRPASQCLGSIQSKPSVVRLMLADFCFCRVLSPHHTLTNSTAKHLATFMLYCRGHLRKMPIGILLAHALVKSWIVIRNKLFGQATFEKNRG